MTAETTTPIDPLWLSLVRGRGMVVIASLSAFTAAAHDWWQSVQVALPDGVTLTEMHQILDAAGPMIDAGGNLYIMAATAISAALALWSKARELWRQRAGAAAT